MSKQRVIKDDMWDDEWFFDLDPIEKLVWCFILTNPRSNIAGVYKMSLRWSANMLGLDPEVVKTILKRFEKDGKIVYQDDWIALVNFHKHLVYKNPSVSKGIERIGETLTGCPQAVYSVYLTLLNLTLPNGRDSSLPLEDENMKKSWSQKKKYNENGHWEEPSLDIDSQTFTEDEEEKVAAARRALRSECRGYIKKLFPAVGIPVPDPKQMNRHLKDYEYLLNRGWSHEDIGRTLLKLTKSEFWQTKMKEGSFPGLHTVEYELSNKQPK